MDFRVLGTIDVNGFAPPGAKERAILARLLIEPGAAVPADALLDAALGGRARAVAARSLAVRIANLRAFLEPDRDRGAPSVAARPRRRRLPARDRARAGRRPALRARRARGAATLPPGRRARRLRRALALWRGRPFGGARRRRVRAAPRSRRLESCAARRSRAARARSSRSAGRSRPIAELRRLVGRRPAARGARAHADARAVRARAARSRRSPPTASWPRGCSSSASARRRDARARAPHPRPGPGARPASPPAGARAGRSRAPTRRRRPRARARAPARGARARALGPPRAAVLRPGEPGVGKTTLVDAFAAPRPSAATACSPRVGQCVAHRGPGEPYMPVLEALGALARGPGRRPRRRACSRSARRPGWSSCRGCSTRTTAPRRCASARRARRATRMLREMLEALDALCAPTPARARARGPALGRRLDARPRRRAAAPAPRRPGCCCSARYRRPPAGPAPVAELAHELSRARPLRGGPVGAARRRAPSPPTWARASPAAALPTGLAGAAGQPLGRQPAVHAQPASTTGSPRTCCASSDGVRRARAAGGAARPASRRRCAPTSATSSSGSTPRRRAARGGERRRARVRVDRRSPRRSGATRDDVSARCAVLAGGTRLIEQPRRASRASPTTCTARCSTSCCRRMRARAAARAASARSSRDGRPRARDRRPSSASTSSPAATPSAPCASCAWPASARSRATRTPRAIRHLRAALDAAAELRGGSERTRAEVELLSLARPGARRDRRLVGAPRPRTRCCAPASSRAQLRRQRAARLRPARARDALRAARRVRARAGDGARVPARSRPAAAPSTSSRRHELLACNLFHQGSFAPRARVRRARRRAVRDGRRAAASTRPSRRRSATTPASRATTGPALALWFLGHPDQRAGARDARARARARPEPRLQPRHRARADRGACTSAGASPRRRSSGPRRRSPRAQRARLRLPRGDGPRAARLGARAAGRRRRRASREIADGLAASRAHGRADGRPALPRRCSPTRTCAPATLDAGLAAVARRSSSRARERSLFYEPELHRLDGALHAAAGRRARRRAALRRGLARAREQGSRALELRIATDLARLLADPAARGRGARWRRARRYARFDEGFDTRDLREAAACSALRRSRRRPRARARARRARRGRRRRRPSSGGRASAAGTRSTRSRRRTPAASR